MKKIFVLVSLCSALTLVLFPTANFVFAAAANCDEYCVNKSLGEPIGTSCVCNPLKVNDFEALLNIVIDFIFWIGMALAPVMFIVAGLLYVTAAGNPQKTEQAKKIIIYTVIGLVVLLLARGLTEVLKSVIGAK